MLKQVPAKCPRRWICSGTPLQGQARGPTDPTHALIQVFPPSSSTLFQTIQTWLLFSRPVDQLYDNVPTLKSIAVCLNSLRVVSPGVQRRLLKKYPEGPRDADRKSCPYKTPSPNHSAQRSACTLWWGLSSHGSDFDF